MTMTCKMQFSCLLIIKCEHLCALGVFYDRTTLCIDAEMGHSLRSWTCCTEASALHLVM